MSRDLAHPRLPRAGARARQLLRAGLLLLGLLPLGAHAVVFYFNAGGGRSITLRVGSNNAAINAVRFTVNNANVAPNPAPVTGVPEAGATGGNPTNGILFQVSSNRRSPVRVLADSSAGLACVGGGCGATVIPFSEISWTSNGLQTGGDAGQDIQSGRFNGSATQQILAVTVPGGSNSFFIQNTLVFTYDNDVLYPSGNYRGRVTFTAVAP